MKSMKLRALAESIRSMPRPAYLLLKFVLMLSGAMLLAALGVYFSIDEHGIHNCRALPLAILLTENPAGVLLVGGILVCFIFDRSK